MHYGNIRVYAYSIGTLLTLRILYGRERYSVSSLRVLDIPKNYVDIPYRPGKKDQSSHCKGSRVSMRPDKIRTGLSHIVSPVSSGFFPGNCLQVEFALMRIGAIYLRYQHTHQDSVVSNQRLKTLRFAANKAARVSSRQRLIWQTYYQ